MPVGLKGSWLIGGFIANITLKDGGDKLDPDSKGMAWYGQPDGSLSPSLRLPLQNAHAGHGTIQQKSFPAPACCILGMQKVSTAFLFCKMCHVVCSNALQMGAPGVLPFGHAPPQPQLPHGYMMYPNGAMGHQGMMPYGYPPTMTPVPMLTHPRTAQQGDMTFHRLITAIKPSALDLPCSCAVLQEAGACHNISFGPGGLKIRLELQKCMVVC